MNFFKKLFKGNKETVFDIEKAVGEYLLRLPRCSKYVAVVSPKYGESYYTCEIIVAAEDLAHWAENHAQAVWSLNQEEQAARKTLPIWLRGADVDSKTTSYVPHFMYEVLRPYVLDFVENGTTNIYCFECQSFVENVQMNELNRQKMGDWSFWTEIWKCPNGHMLYQEAHELHIHHRK
ncbi:MAG: hypothetical protein ACYDAI_17060 [Trichloromonadaceae bacterium]